MKNTLFGTTLEVNADGSISWEDLAKFFGPANFIVFQSWMYGQTCTITGPYAWDVEKYIKGARKIED